jgi:hypothetical protein
MFFLYLTPGLLERLEAEAVSKLALYKSTLQSILHLACQFAMSTSFSELLLQKEKPKTGPLNGSYKAF